MTTKLEKGILIKKGRKNANRARAIALFELKTPILQIARVCKVKAGSIYRWLREAGKYEARGMQKTVDWNEVLESYKKDGPVATAAKFGIGKPHVHYIVRKIAPELVEMHKKDVALRSNRIMRKIRDAYAAGISYSELDIPPYYKKKFLKSKGEKNIFWRVHKGTSEKARRFAEYIKKGMSLVEMQKQEGVSYANAYHFLWRHADLILAYVKDPRSAEVVRKQSRAEAFKYVSEKTKIGGRSHHVRGN